MKTTMAILILATTAGAFEFRIEELREGFLDRTPANPFDGPDELIDVTETFHADASPFLLEILRWDYIAADGTLLAAVTPHSIDLPFLVTNGPGFTNQYLTLDDSPAPWGEDIRWSYADFPRMPDLVEYRPASGDRVGTFDFTTGDGRYLTVVSTNRYFPVPEPSSHIMLAIVGVLAWCVARRGRA